MLNITTLSNKVLSLGYEKPFIDSGQARTRLNGPLAEIFLYKTDGIFKTQEQIDNYVTPDGEPIMISGKRPQLGDVKYIDTDNNGQITADDRQFCGSPWAKMQMSLVLNAEWKDFDFSMMWNGQFGNKIYNVSKWQGRLFSDNSNYLRFKKGEEPYQVNQNSDTPRIIYGDQRNSWMRIVSLKTVLISDCKNISIGYNLEKGMVEEFGY